MAHGARDRPVEERACILEEATVVVEELQRADVGIGTRQRQLRNCVVVVDEAIGRGGEAIAELLVAHARRPERVELLAASVSVRCQRRQRGAETVSGEPDRAAIGQVSCQLVPYLVERFLEPGVNLGVAFPRRRTKSLASAFRWHHSPASVPRKLTIAKSAACATKQCDRVAFDDDDVREVRPAPAPLVLALPP